MEFMALDDQRYTMKRGFRNLINLQQHQMHNNKQQMVDLDELKYIKLWYSNSFSLICTSLQSQSTLFGELFKREKIM